MQEIKAEITIDFDEGWDAHRHGDEEFLHVHAPGADWAVSFGLPMQLKHDADLSLVGVLEFRGVALNMARALYEQRLDAELDEMSPESRQLTVITYNVDRMALEALLAVTGKLATAHGINPPVALQRVQSSNVRSIGYVQTEDKDGTVITGTLYVAYHHRTQPTLYRYFDFPMELAEELAKAAEDGASVGKMLRSGYLQGFAYELVGSNVTSHPPTEA